MKYVIAVVATLFCNITARYIGNEDISMHSSMMMTLLFIISMQIVEVKNDK